LPTSWYLENRVSARKAERANITLASRTGQFAHFRVVTPGRLNLLIRCLVWVVSKLGHGCDSEFELTGAVVGGGSEVDEILESSSHPLG